jgi:hypothetical protein
MLTSILPVVRGETSRSRWLRIALSHTAGNIAAAAITGAVLSLVAARISAGSKWLWIAALAALVYIPREMNWWRFPPLLQSTRQVPQEWAYEYSSLTTACLYGLGLGSGLYTRIVVPTYYLLIVWPFVTGGFWGPMVVWCVYGLARSAHLWWLAGVAPIHDPLVKAIRMVEALSRQSERMHRANAGLILCVGGYLAWRSFLT